MNVKSAAKTTGRGLGLFATALIDSGPRIRIAEIDREIAELQAERDRLSAQLINKI